MDCRKFALFWALIVSYASDIWGLKGFNGTYHGVCYEHHPVLRTRIEYVTSIERYCKKKFGSYCNNNGYWITTIPQIRSFQQVETRTICCTGYIERNGECHPTCLLECENGYCSAINTCTCNAGYKKVAGTENICRPICSTECSHGTCIKPETCSCDAGYEPSANQYVCNPSCQQPCWNGKCTAPEHCTCDIGYESSVFSTYMCVAICSKKCVNGDCLEPEKCSCNDGYAMSSQDKYTCEPICSKQCKNGTCVAPETCSCDVGYEKEHSDESKCRPICSKECKNGECNAPDTCSCFSGYKKSPDDPFICEPICQDSCVNANCTAPNICSCIEGFVKHDSSTNICVPHCSKGCLNGVCSAPNSCTCYEGYKKSNTTNECKPVCSEGCVNSDCTSPEMCSCLMGYQKQFTNPYVCEPTCSQPCKNSKCKTPEICICEEGYIHSVDEDPYTCIPHCISTCVNSNCTKPYECECFTGYVKDYYKNNTCNPICLNSCQNGDCTEPDVCSCWPGYERSETSHICHPLCDSCQHGYCTAPEVCECGLGYENPPDSNATCVPKCDAACVNSKCVDPNVCSCDDGHVKSHEHDHVCNPHCSQPCVNGNCTAPEVCECFSGYNLSLGSQNECNPVCTEECINSVCAAPETCKCLWGYQGSKNCADVEPQMECSFRGMMNLNNSEIIKSPHDDGTHKFSLDNCKFLEFFLAKHATTNERQIPQVIIKLNCSLIDTYDISTNELTINCLFISMTPKNLTNLPINTTEQVELSFHDDFAYSTTTYSTATDFVEGEVPEFYESKAIDLFTDSDLFEHIFNENIHKETATEEPDEESTAIIHTKTDINVASTILDFHLVSSTEKRKGVLSTINVPKDCVNLPRTSYVYDINIDNTLFIADEVITADYFDDVLESKISRTWCICSNNFFDNICYSNEEVEFHICSCNKDSVHKLGDAYKWWSPVSWQLTQHATLLLSILLVLLGSIICMASFYIICRYYKPRHYFIEELEESRNMRLVTKENEVFMEEESFIADNESFCEEIIQALRTHEHTGD